jgi:chromosome segregation ATPase
MLLEELRIQINRLSTDLDAAYSREIAERERHAGQVLRLEERLTDMQAERDRWAGLAETSQQQMAQLAAKLAEAEKSRRWWPWRRSA